MAQELNLFHPQQTRAGLVNEFSKAFSLSISSELTSPAAANKCNLLFRKFFEENKIDTQTLQNEVYNQCKEKNERARNLYSEESHRLMATYFLDKCNISETTLKKLIDELNQFLKQNEIPVIRSIPFNQAELLQLISNDTLFDDRPDFKLADQGNLAFCNLEEENREHYVTLTALSVTHCECIILKDTNSNRYWMLHVEVQQNAVFTPTGIAKIITAINKDENLKDISVDAIVINKNSGHSPVIEALSNKGVKISIISEIDCYPGHKTIFFSPRDGKITIYHQENNNFEYIKTNLVASTATPSLRQ